MSRSTRYSGFVCGCLVSLICVIGVSACTETTDPEQVAMQSPPVTAPAPSSALDSLGLWVGDATAWVLPSVPDEELRETVRAKIAELGTHITVRRYDLARRDIAALQSIMSSVDIDLLHALGPIEVAMKVIEAALDEAGIPAVE